jgi:hypothetical protein
MKLTPSSMGTEKKSQPVSLAIPSPPGTPGRYTKLGSTRPFSPLTALMTFSAKLRGINCNPEAHNTFDLPEASVRHGESGGTCTILGLDNLITTKLHTLN